MVGGVSPMSKGIMSVSSVQIKISNRMSRMMNNLMKGSMSPISPNGAIQRPVIQGARDTGIGLMLDLNA